MPDDILIRTAQSSADYDACVALQRAVWGLSDLEIISSLQFISAIHAGAMLHLAVTPSGEVTGFAFAIAALRDGVPHLHSDMLAVRPEHQARGVGVRLKWAQREAALARGLHLITWTFDPLQARNANLNLRRLGGRATEFLEDFYGVTTSALHHGLPTDRLLVRWELDAPHVQGLAQQGEPRRTLPTPELPRINEVRWQAGWPVSSEPQLELDDPALLLEIPPEWDVLCQAAPRVAESWQARVRLALRTYFGRGYLAAGFAPTEDGGRRRPLYVLKHVK